MRIEYLGRIVRICTPYKLSRTPLEWFRTESMEDEVVFLKRYLGKVSKVHPSRRTIYVSKEDDPFRMLSYGLRMILAPRYMQHLLVHASCVSDGKYAYVFMGKPGSGKTTLLRYLLSKGFYYVSEDMLPMDETFAYLSLPFKVDPERFVRKAHIREIYVISYLPGSIPLRLKLEERAFLSYLLEQSFNSQILGRRFLSLAKALFRFNVYFLRYSNFEDVEKLLAI